MVFTRMLFLAAACALTGAAQSGFSPAAIDSSVSPCSNFYQYACGNWLKTNPIPADQSSWGRFSELYERNQRTLRDILETATAKQQRSPAEQKIGDYYAACMDEKAIEAKGLAPLKPMLDAIDNLKTKAELSRHLADLHRKGVNVLFRSGSEQDLKQADQVIAGVDQGGLGLPERDYYFKTDANSVSIREAYADHLRRIFELAGDKPEAATAKAKRVLEIETELARGHLDVTSRRDPYKLYHRMPVKELAALAPSIDWPKYLADIGATQPTLNVAVPEYFKTMDAQLRSVSLDDWKAYLKWHLFHAASPLLPEGFVQANFDFYSKKLMGAKEMRPRWKRCVQYVNGDLGEALGQKYVELTFGEQGKQRTLEMVRALTRALEKDIQQLDWMTDNTKKKALAKLSAITNKIGYPEKWRDYSALKIQPGDPVGNSFRANEFESRRQMAKIGKPVDKNEWYMTPPTVNAYYDPQNNNINFPAGILQPPFYENTMDIPVNLGAIGAVIGHELSHGFDDEGGKFDPQGNLANWWTEEDRKEFERRTECMQKQYGEYTAIGDIKLNGKLTLGENVADNGGLRIAYMAMLDMLADKTLEKKDGFTPAQRLFLGWGQIWCTNQREETTRLRAQTDPHSPAEWRVNGTVSNMPEFWKAFGCTQGQPMVRGENACRVW